MLSLICAYGTDSSEPDPAVELVHPNLCLPKRLTPEVQSGEQRSKANRCNLGPMRLVPAALGCSAGAL